MAPYKWVKRKARPMPLSRRKMSHSHPSRGGTRGYGLDMRQSALRVHREGQENDRMVRDMREQHVWPCKKTTFNWDWRDNNLGFFTTF